MPSVSQLYDKMLEFSEGQVLVPERPGWGSAFSKDYIDHLASCD